MHANLETTLKSARPREKSGSRTVGRYDYQAHCGLLKLFELHETKDDFQIVFDYFDDILVLDRADAPSAAELFQVKTKGSGDWTTANLCKLVGKEAPRSIVARLYDHLVVLGEQVVTTSFITNASFKVTLKDGKKSTGEHHWITGPEIHDDDIQKIKTAIEEDVSPCDMDQWRPRLVLIRSPMGIHGQKAYVIGILHEYFSNILDLPDVNLSPLYETLYETIQQCTRFSQEGLASDDLIRKKSITRAEIDAIIERVRDRSPSFLSDWPTISADLRAAGVASIRELRLKTAATKHLADRSAGHALANEISDAARAWASDHPEALASAEEFYELTQTIATNLDYPELSGDELIGALLVEAYEVVNGQR